MINILHLINGYWSRDLYALLVSELSEKEIKQTVFIPVRKKEDIGKYKVKKENINYLYAYIIKSFVYRAFFWLKIRKSVKYIMENRDVKENNLSHAHTLFSDGAISYYFFKKFNIPYVVTVRNTDLNIFYKYLFYLRPLGKKILLNAEKIIFLSEAYKHQLINRYTVEEIKTNLSKKSVVIPNGINNFWHEHVNSEIKKKNKDDLFTFVFAGEFKKNKNIHSIIQAVELLRNKGYNCVFKAIGLGFNDEENYVKYLFELKKNKDYIEFVDTVEKEELLEYYRNSDIFIMPSFKETFGLVYAEALSQGLPVIYTKNEGFDKNFEDGFVGYSVDPKSINDIAEKTELIINDFATIQEKCIEASAEFKWRKISDKISTTYFNILNL